MTLIRRITEGMRGIRRGKDSELDYNSDRRRVNIHAVVLTIKPEHVVYAIAEMSLIK